MNKIRTLNNETTQEELYSYPKRLDKLDSKLILIVKVKLIRLVNPLEHAPFRLKVLEKF
jgi:hypothetical protein